MKSRHNISISRFFILALILALFCSATYASEWNDSDAYPDVQSVWFSSRTVGFIVGKDYLVMDRVSGIIIKNEKSKFMQSFPNVRPISTHTRLGPDEWVTSFASSNGSMFDFHEPYCHEDSKRAHKLLLSTTPVALQIDPCNGLMSLDVVGDNLWVGAIGYGMDSIVPADGIVVQSMKTGRLVAKTREWGGSEWAVPTLLRFDPFWDKVWVFYRDGFNLLSKDVEVKDTYYWTIDFDPVSKIPAIGISKSAARIDTFAALGLFSNIRDPKYLETLEKIPDTVKAEVDLYSVEMGMYYYDVDRPNHFAPKELNVLVPYFIKSGFSVNSEHVANAIETLCLFNDPRVYVFLRQIINNGAQTKEQAASWSGDQTRTLDWAARRCINKQWDDFK